jgi:signal transduction histidine kinase
MLPAAAAAIAPASVLLRELLAVSLTGLIFYTPLYDPAGSGAIVDFTFEYLNPAAQRMMAMPEVPTRTHNQQWPHSVAHGTFQFHVEAFESGQPRQYHINYQADGYDNYYCLAARRAGNGLLVSFTDTADQPRSPVETALRASQAAEQAARAEAERQRGELERVFEQAPAAIAVYRGPNYTIELANATVARLWGRTREQLLGKGLFEALPEVAGMGYEQLLDGVMRTGIPHVAQAMEAQHDRNGQRETVYWDFVYVPLYDAQEQINGAMVVATEVTDQVRARRQVEQHNQELEARVQARTHELAEQQRLLQQILAQVPAAITTLWGPEHRFTYANARYQHLVEHRVQVGQTVAETLPEIAEQGFVALLDNVYRHNQPFEGKEIAVLLAQPDGPPVQHYLDFTYQPMLDEHGQPQGILVFAVDVTEQVRTRRQAETMQAALLAVAQRRAQERQDLLALFEQAPVAVALLRDADHQLDYFNSRFAHLFPGEQVRGRSVAAAYPTLATAALMGQLDHVYQTGETYQQAEVVLPTPTPAPARYITFTCQAYYEDGRIAGVAVFVYEVSEQVLARQQVQALNRELAAINAELTATNEEVQQSNAQLTRTNADLDTFVYAASHDLKAPIANIEGLLDVLIEYLPAAEQQPLVPRVVDMMQGAIRRFQQTVGHLTEVARLPHTAGLGTDEVDVPQLLEDVRLDLLPLLASTQAQLHTQVESCSRVRLPAKNMRSVLFNLLSNALKYRAPDRPPVVQVRAQCSATRFTLTVQDNGLGLSELQQGQLFTMFRRLHTHVDGSGVGLYLIRRMIELAGGHIAVQSQVGVGSSFTVTLPRTDHP